MDRRDVLFSLGTGLAVATAGCIADGRVAMEKSESVTVQPQDGWWVELPDIGGDGALSFTIWAEKLFDVYYFTSDDDFEQYKTYIYDVANSSAGTAQEGTATPETTANPGRSPAVSSMPSGHNEISQAAIPKGDSEKYEVQVPKDGGRKSIGTEGAHYLVVDHSNYGDGVQVERFDDPLDAFVDLKVIENQSPI